ncbi:MAG: phosphopantetheine-binding protein [bacterium]|nr:phosphopantetheine-binding protein [bacterium]
MANPPGRSLSMGDTETRLISLVNRNIEVDGQALDIPSDLKVSLVNAGVSSMDIIALAKLVSLEFNVEFTVEECVSLRTLREVVDFLDSKAASATSS